MKKYKPGQAFALDLSNDKYPNGTEKEGIAELVHIVYSVDERNNELRFWTVQRIRGLLFFRYALQPIDIDAFDKLVTKGNFTCLTPEI